MKSFLAKYVLLVVYFVNLVDVHDDLTGTQGWRGSRLHASACAQNTGLCRPSSTASAPSQISSQQTYFAMLAGINLIGSDSLDAVWRAQCCRAGLHQFSDPGLGRRHIVCSVLQTQLYFVCVIQRRECRKSSMIQVTRELHNHPHLRAHIVLQIHDELILGMKQIHFLVDSYFISDPFRRSARR
jgi:hypothetical protein